MENFIYWLFNSFSGLIANISGHTVLVIQNSLSDYGEDLEFLWDLNINLVLFSETPILSTNLYDLLLIFFGVFYTVIFVVIVYKIIKKILMKITGWKKW